MSEPRTRDQSADYVPVGMARERPQPRQGQLTRDDIQPGCLFVWHHPHLANDGGTKLTRVVKSIPYETKHGWAFDVEYADYEGGALPRQSYLTDAGYEPYRNGLWNTNWLERVHIVSDGGDR